MFGGNYFGQYMFGGLIFNFSPSPTSGWQIILKTTTVFTKIVKPSVSWTKIVKPVV